MAFPTVRVNVVVRESVPLLPVMVTVYGPPADAAEAYMSTEQFKVANEGTHEEEIGKAMVGPDGEIV